MAGRLFGPTTHHEPMNIRYMKPVRQNLPGRMLILRTLLGYLLLVSPAYATEKISVVPKPLSKALSVYKQQGIQSFIAALVQGSPLEGHDEMRKQILILEQIEKYYGTYQSVDILHVNPLSDSTRLVYFLINYSEGPVFGKLVIYKNGDRETITSFEFHTKAERVLPDAILVNQ